MNLDVTMLGQRGYCRGDISEIGPETKWIESCFAGGIAAAVGVRNPPSLC